MKLFLVRLFIFLSVVMVFPSCSGGSAERNKQAIPAKEVYQCPMKCSSEQFSEPGKCPVCGMELEKVNPS